MTDVLQTLLDEGNKAQLEHTLTWFSPACFSLGKIKTLPLIFGKKILLLRFEMLDEGVYEWKFCFLSLKNTYPTFWSLLNSIISNLQFQIE